MIKAKNIHVLRIAVISIAVITGIMEAQSVNRYCYEYSMVQKEETILAFNNSGSENINPNMTFSENHIYSDTLGLVCPENIGTYTDLNSCVSVISGALGIDDPNAIIATLSWQMTGATNDKSPTSGVNQINSYAFNEGSTVITYQGKDRYNNSIFCTFTITVADNQVPHLENPFENITVGADLGDCNAIVNWPAPVVSDNCATADQVMIMGNYNSGNSFLVGTTEVFYMIGDGVEYNNETYQFTVTVIDEEPPEIFAPHIISVQCGDPIPDAYTSWQQFYEAGGMAFDNCNMDYSSFKYVKQKSSGIHCPYTITRSYSIADGYGNVSEVEHRIVVEEEEVVEEESVMKLKSAMAGTVTAKATGNWNDPNTWDTGVVPAFDDDVVIPNGYTVSVDINAECNDITINSAGILQFSSAYTLLVHGDVLINGTLDGTDGTLQVEGSLTNNGTYDGGTNGVVEFTGTNAATISGTSTTIFQDFIISKGALSNILQINSDIELDGTITFTSGLMQINNGADVTCTHNAGFTIEDIAGLYINGGSFTSGPFSIENKGTIQIDSGTLTFGINSGNGLTINNSGLFDINGGTVNVAGRLEVSGGSLDISGAGTVVNLNTVGHNSSTTATLDLSLSSDFMMSGGTINFLNPNGSGYFDVEIQNGVGGNKSFSSGTFNFGDGFTDAYRMASDVGFPDYSLSANTSLSIINPVNSIGSYTFPLDDGSGNTILVTVDLNSYTAPLGANPYIEIETFDIKHPNNANSSNYLNRYWTIAFNDISNPSYDINAVYLAGDIANATTDLIVGNYTSSWSEITGASVSGNTVSFSSSSTNLSFTVLEEPTVDITNTDSEVICDGSMVTLNTSAGGGSTLTYSWTVNPVTTVPSGASPTVTPPANPSNQITNYSYTITVTDANGFTASDAIDVIVNPLPDVTATPNSQTICSGTATNISLSGTVGGTVFNWTVSQIGVSGASAGSGNAIAQTLTTTGNSTGIVTYTIFPTANGCTGSPLNLTVTVNPIPTVDAIGSQILCHGEASTLINFSGLVSGTVYNWTNDNNSIGMGLSSTGNIASFTATNTGSTQEVANINVTPVYSSGGENCTGSSETFTITVDPASVGGTASADQTICEGSTPSSLTLNGQVGIIQWQWSPNGSSSWNDIVGATGITLSGAVMGSLSADRYYRSEVTSGICSPAVSNTVHLAVDPTSVGGTIAGSGTVCSGANSTNLTLSGYTGSISRWEYSTNGGANWNSTSNTTTSYTATNLTQTTEYRAVIQSGLCSEATSVVTTVTVDPVSVGGTIAGSGTVCSGTNSTTLTLSGHTGSIQRWEYSTNGGANWNSISNTTTSYIAINLTQTTEYRAVVQSGLCSEATSTIATVTVDPVSDGGTIAGSETVCSGTNSTTLTLSGYTGAIQRWEYSTNGGVNWISIANITASYATTNLTQTTEYRAVVQSGLCNDASSSIATVTVDPVSVGGTIAGSGAVCSGTNSTILTLSGYTGSVQRWEYSTDGGSNWNSISNTTASYTATNLTQTTEYQTIVQNGVCSEVNSAVATVTIDPASVGGTIAGSTTVCSGTNSTNLSLSGHTGTIQRWEYSTDGGSNWNSISNTSASYTAVNLIQTTEYRAVLQSGVCPETNSAVATVTVDPVSIGGTASADQTICEGSTPSDLTLTGQVGSIQWQESPNGSSSWTDISGALGAILSGADMGSLSADRYYRAEVTSGVCVIVYSNTVHITVNPIPTASISGTIEVCEDDANPMITISNPEDLPVTVTYDVTGSGTTTVNVGANSSVLITHIISGDGVFNYDLVSVAYQPASSCLNSVSGTATVTVKQTPTVYFIDEQILCNDKQISGFTLSGPVPLTTFTWTNSNPAIGLASSGFGDIQAFTSTNTTNAPITGTITVTPTADGCEGTPFEFDIIVNPTPTVSISGSTTVCQNDAEPDITFTNPLALPVTVTYRMNSVVQPTVNVVGNGTATIAVPTSTADTYTYELVSAEYQSAPSCVEGLSGTAIVIVDPRANAVATPASQEICSTDAITTIVLSSSTSGIDFEWTRNNTASVTGIAASGTGDILGTLTNTTTAPVIVTFTITPMANGCDGTPTIATVTVNPIPIASVLPLTQTRCSGIEAISAINPSSTTGGTSFIWTRDYVAEVTGIDAFGTGSIPTITLTNTTSAPITVTFTFTPSANNCDGPPVTASAVINPTPLIVDLTENICNSGSFDVLPVDGIDGVVPSGTNFSWAIQSSTGGITSATSGSGSSIIGTLGNSTNTTQTVTYAVTPTFNGCIGEIFLLVVNVTPEPDISDMTATVCSDGTFTITPLNGTDGIVPTGTSYNWVVDSFDPDITGYESDSGTSISGTLSNSGNTAQTVIYSVTPAGGTCNGDPFTLTVTVNPVPVISNMAAGICSGETFSVTPVHGTDGTVPLGVTYSWSAPVVTGGVSGGTIGGGAASISGTLINPTSIAQTTTYTVTPSSGGCDGDPFTLTVTVDPKPSVNPMTTSICSDEIFTLTPVDVTNGTIPANTTYSWSAPSTVGITGTAPGADASSISGMLTNTTNTAKAVTYTVTPSVGGCTGISFSVVVTVNPAPDINDIETTICSGSVFSATPVNGTDGFVPSGTTYDWVITDDGGVLDASGGNGLNMSGTLTNSSATGDVQTVIYEVTPTAGSCTGTPFNLTVNVNPTPDVAISGGAAVCYGGVAPDITFTNSVNLPVTVTYTIDGGADLTHDITGSGTAIVTAIVNQEGTFVYSLESVAYQTSPDCSTPVSGTTTVTVEPITTVVISSSPSGPICFGESVTYTANVNNEGSGAAYQWYNGTTAISGATGTSYTSSTLNNADEIKLVVTTLSTPCPGDIESNVLTMTVNALTVPEVSVYESVNSICEGTSVTFTADPVIDGGTNPTFEWLLNDVTVGGNSSTYTNNTLADGDEVKVVLFPDASASCPGPQDTSDAITMTVNPNLPVSVSIVADYNPVCAGTAVTFSVTPVNGGTTPDYQWYVEGTPVGTNSPTYTSSSLNDGEVVSVELTSSEVCTSGNPVTDAVTMTVNPNLPVSVNIVADANPVCDGTVVTYTATPTNGGGSPSYQWLLNGTPVGGETSDTYSYVPSDGNLVSVELTSSETCVSGSPATDALTMTVNPNLPVTVSIVADANPVCDGNAVTFTATPTNGGTTPGYQWKVNGVDVGPDSPTYIYAPANGDNVSVVLTSSEVCNSGSPATSNTVTMTVNPDLPVSVSLVADANPVCEGTAVAYTATPTNGGTTPGYQWYVDGSPVGTDNPTYTYIPLNGEVVSVELTSSEVCSSGNPATDAVTMTVDPILPVSVSIAADATEVCAPTTVNFSATPINGGTTPSYQWLVGGSPIAGATGATYNHTPSDGDIITLELISGITCVTDNPATSNSITLEVVSAPPAIPGPITGSSAICPTKTETYSIDPVSGAETYIWTVPGGWTNMTGQGTTSITVDVPSGASSGDVTVTAVNVCGNTTGTPYPVTVDNSASVYAGPDQIVCEGTGVVTLAGETDGAINHKKEWDWEAIDGGTINNPDDLGSSYSLPSGYIGILRIAILADPGLVSCSLPNDTMIITVLPNPTVNAGGTDVVCESATPSPILLSGATVGGGASTGAWSITSGGGTLSSTAHTASPEAVTYTPAANFSGTVTLTLTTDAPANCSPASATRTITVDPVATVDAGGPDEACQSSSPVAITLSGASVGGSASTGAWSIVSGGGSLSSTTQTATPETVTYTPTVDFSGTVTLELTTDASGLCPAVSATRTITVTEAPTADAGGPDEACQSSSPVAITLLGASVGGSASTGAWSIVSGGGSLSSTVQTATPETVTYTPAADFSGTVTLQLITDATGVCPAVSAIRILTVYEAATADAGGPDEACQSSSPVAITLFGASVGGGATTGAWSIVSGGGSLSSTAQTASPETVTFTPDANFSGTVTLTLTTDASGICPAVSATRTITINELPTVDAGGPDEACESGIPSAITLAGASVGGGATTGAWSITSGGGGLSSTAQTASPETVTYTPDANTSGTVILILTTDAPTGCSPTSATRTITVNPTVTVDAGTYGPICSGSLITLVGNISGGATGTWTGGAGTFTPDPNTLTATYEPSGAEVAAGTVTLTLTANDPLCGSVSASTTITINRAVVIASQPLNTAACVGDAVDFTVAAVGTGLTNQWYKDGAQIPGETSPTLSISLVSLADDGEYYVVVSGVSPCTPVASSIVTLNVDAAISVTTQPADQIKCEGENVTFSVVADANGASLTYQWRKDGVDIAGATSSAYMLSNISASDADSYDVLIGSSAGFSCSSVTSSAATLTLNENGTITLSGDDNQTVCAGNVITDISYTIGGSANDAVLSGALPTGVSGSYSGGVFTITGTPTESGTFNYTVTTTGSLCVNPSLSGTITVDDVGTISLGGGTATQTLCINNPLTEISYLIGGDATGAVISAGSLPAGVSGSYNPTSGLFSISGTPTAVGTYPFTVATTGSSCANPELSGEITVNADATIVLTSGTADQTLCIGTAVTPISYTIGGAATGVVMSGSLPAGVTGTLSGNIYTILGMPTAMGTFNYTLTTTGPCINNSLSGSIQVDNLPDGGFLSPSVSTTCTADNNGTLTLQSYNGNVIQWEMSLDGGNTWTVIPNTTDSYNYTDIPSTALFTALVGNANCTPIYSGIARVTVIPEFTPVITTTGGDICAGEPVTLTGTVAVLPDTLGAFAGGLFNQANPKGWQVYEDGLPLFPFPASNDNEKKGPWAETNGPKEFCGNDYDSGEKKFSIVHGDDINSWMETPVFSLASTMSSAALTFDHAYDLAADATARVMLSTDGGATYSIVLADYSGTGALNSGMPNVVNDIELDMSAYIGLENMRIRFEFDSPTTCSIWAIDNISIPSPPPDVTYSWGPIEYFPGGEGSVVVVLPLTTTTYTLTVYIAGCPGSATEEIVYIINNPEVTTTNACAGGDPVTFVQTGAPAGGIWSVTGGGTIDANGVFTATEPGCFVATYTTEFGDCSGSASFVVFPAAPAPDVNLGCGPIVVTPPPAVAGFDIEYSFDNGVTWGGNTPPTADNCDGYYIKTRYMLTVACDVIAAGEISADPVCSESLAVIRPIDSSAPTFTVPADITISKDADCNYDASIGVTGDVTDETDNCSTGLDATYSDVIIPGLCEGEVSIERTWILEDDCGYQNVQIQTITVADNNEGPTFTVPADITIYRDAACNYDASVGITGDVNDEADNCSIILDATFSDAVDNTDPCNLIITRTWTLADDCGTTTTGIQTITVADLIAPVISPLASNGNTDCSTINPDDDPAYQAWLANHGGAVATDACDNLVWTDNSASQSWSGDPANNEITITFTVTDECGNPAQTTATYSVTDDDSPTITCPVSSNVAEPDLFEDFVSGDGCTWDPTNVPDPTISDLCGLDRLVYTLSGATTGSSPSAGYNYVRDATLNLGITTVTYTLYDIAGNSATCAIRVWVKNLDEPQFDVTCPTGDDQNIVVPAALGLCVADVTIPAPVIDNFCDEIFGISYQIDSDPVVTVTPPAPVGGIVTLNSLLETFDVGTHTITWTITSASGTDYVCAQTVSVYEDQDPIITCPVSSNVAEPDLFEDFVSGDGCTWEPASVPDPTISDFCGLDRLVYTLSGVTTGSSPSTGFNYVSSASLNLGITTVTYTLYDLAGNSATCAIRVWVKNIDDPQFNVICPTGVDQTINVPAEPAVCEAEVTIPAPSIENFCDEVLNIAYQINSDPVVTVTPPAAVGGVIILNSLLETFDVGTHTITWIITSASGTDYLCNQTVTVYDDQDPTITCPVSTHPTEPDLFEEFVSGDGCEWDPVNVPNPTDADNCGVVAVTYTLSGATTGTSPATGFNYVSSASLGLGITTVTYTSWDEAGNSSEPCAIRIWTKNIDDPHFNVICPATTSITVPADPGVCDAEVTVPAPSIDNFCVEVYSATYQIDSEAAVSVTVPAPVGGISTLDDLIETFDVGIHNVRWTISSASGTPFICDIAVEVEDTDPPTISCPVSTHPTEPDLFEEFVSGDGCEWGPTNVPNPIPADDCGVVAVTYTLSGATTGSSAATGFNYVSSYPPGLNLGITTVTYTAWDLEGNSSEPCAIRIWTKNIDEPHFNVICPATTSITVPADPGVCDAEVTVPAPSIDNFCVEVYSATYQIDSEAAVSVTVPAPVGGISTLDDLIETFDVGIHNVRWTISSASGTPFICDIAVEVEDTDPPTISCPVSTHPTEPDLFEEFVSGDGCEWAPTNVPNPIPADDCGVVAVTYTLSGATTGSSAATGFNDVSSYPPGLNLGITTVTYTAWDLEGNSSEPCAIRIWTKNIDEPHFNVICPATTSITVSAEDYVCDAEVTVPAPSIDNFCVEIFDITYQIDSDPPVQVTAPAPVGGITTLNQLVERFEVGTHTVIWTITSASGTPYTCEITVEVTDLMPFVDCPPDIDVQALFNLPYRNNIGNLAPLDWGDNCPDSVLTWALTPPAAYTSEYAVSELSGTGEYPSPNTFYLGVTTITYTVTDRNGNQASCPFTITVSGPPLIDCPDLYTTTTDPGLCTATLNSDDYGLPTLEEGVPPIVWTWTIINPDGSLGATGTYDEEPTGVPGPPAIPDYEFWQDTSTIIWQACNISGCDECSHQVVVEDKEPPTLDADPYEDCVDMIEFAIYNPTNPNPEYHQFDPNLEKSPSPDYSTMIAGDTYLDLTSLEDNCCDSLSMVDNLSWTINFQNTIHPIDGSTIINPPVSGTGQPSSYGSNIQLWGDGVDYTTLVHTITYQVTDCNGNLSEEIVRTITITPRPQIIKQN